jgi:hypothetical protein
VGQLIKAIGRWSIRRSANEERKGGNKKEIRQKESMVEAGHSTIGDGLRVSS